MEEIEGGKNMLLMWRDRENIEIGREIGYAERYAEGYAEGYAKGFAEGMARTIQ